MARQSRMVDRFLAELDSGNGEAHGAAEAAGQATTPTGAGQ